MSAKTLLIAALLALSAVATQAFQVSSMSPQGEVARVRQVVLKFDEAAISFGAPKAEAPVDLLCANGVTAKGAGRWLNERTWVF